MKTLGIGLLTVVMCVVFTGMAFAQEPVTITIWDFKYGDTTSGVQAAMQKVDEVIMKDGQKDHMATLLEIVNFKRR